jgi:uncharacterized protein YydD (DUF2326 family)
VLRRLTADDPRFRTVEFQPGLNILVARSTESSVDTDSRNGLGKSSLVELLHFLLGGQPKPDDLVRCAALRNWTFALELDWPSAPGGRLEVLRSGARPAALHMTQPGIPDLFDEYEVTLQHWQQMIERDLFGLPVDHPGLSGRMMLSFLIRRASNHGFNDPTRSFDRQRDVDATPNLAYLLGLDAGLAAKYKQLSERRTARADLKKASTEPGLFGAVVGTTGDLNGEISVARADIERLAADCASFNVVPRYEDLQGRADEINRSIRDMFNRDFADRRNMETLERAIAASVDPEVAYLPRVYEELGIILPDEVMVRFDQVREFHAAVVRNRRDYLQQDLTTTQAALSGRSAQREELGAELTTIMKQLGEGGALEGLQTLQSALAKRQADLEQLEKRLAVAQALTSTSNEIKAAEVELQRQVTADLTERRTQIDAANSLFLDLVRRMYGSAHTGYLSIQPTASSLKITPKIDSDDSTGINHISTFCFDFTLAILAHRGGRGPDFLVHDSHLFDGVDERQLKLALEAAVELTEREQMQYILTINEDDLDKASDLGFDPDPYIIEPHLTDADPAGGLFGFRFDREKQRTRG